MASIQLSAASKQETGSTLSAHYYPPMLARILPALAFFLVALQPAHALERWIYCAQNLWVDKNLDTIEALMRRGSKAGYTHLLLYDSKFAKLGDMDARYFRNIERLKKLAAELKVEIVPAVFPVGYSNDLLWHDPNLVEALPVRPQQRRHDLRDRRPSSDDDGGYLRRFGTRRRA